MSYRKIRAFIFKKRRIQIHLVAIFLVLLAGSSSAITRYTYTAYRKDIGKIALRMINQTSDLLSEKVRGIKGEVQVMLEVIKGSIQTNAEITGQNLGYTNFLINIIKQDPFITEITMGTPEGDYFAIMDTDFIGRSLYFYSRPLEKIPEETSFVVRIIRHKGSSFEEVWKYLNEKGAILAEESIVPATSDFNQNPWVLEMIKDPNLRWAKELLPRGVQSSKSKRVLGLTLSDVVRDSKEEIVAIVSVSVTLKKLSDYVSEQNLGGNGSAFIIDKNWNIEVPIAYGATPEQVFKKSLVEECYKIYEKDKKSNFSLIQQENEYLVSVHESIDIKKEWSVLIIVPFSDLFGFIIKTQNHTRLMSLFIIIVGAFAVYYCSRYFSRPIVQLAKEIDKIREFDFTEGVSSHSLIKEVHDLEVSIGAMRTAVHSFGRYVPKDVVRDLVKHGQDVHPGGEKLEVTIMFSDIEGFTTISESMPMENLMAILSDYFDVMSKIVLSEEGTIDKYIGDSVMAFWGAPLKIVDHAEKACLTSLLCLAAIKEQKKWVTRFGLHTGEVIVGNMGTAERLNYTVMGDAVNIASRLEGINKEYHTSIMISESVHEKIDSSFVTRPIDFVAVKGKKNKLKIFELMGTIDGVLAATLEQIELSKLFTKAYEILEEGKLEEALRSFLAIEKKFPLDFPTKKYLERIKRELDTKPS